MGATKYEAYTEELIEYAKFFKALGHPARLAALTNRMKSEGEAGFEELFQDIDLAQSTKSEHLKLLTDHGIVITRLVINNNRSCLRYRINVNALEFVSRFIQKLFIDTKNRTFKLNNFYSHYKHHLEWNLDWMTQYKT